MFIMRLKLNPGGGVASGERFKLKPGGGVASGAPNGGATSICYCIERLWPYWGTCIGGKLGMLEGGV